MNDYLLNSLQRSCGNCVFSEVNDKNPKFYLCGELPLAYDLRLCNDIEDDRKVRASVPHFAVCDLHQFDEEHRTNMARKLKENPEGFEPKKKKFNLFKKKT